MLPRHVCAMPACWRVDSPARAWQSGRGLLVHRWPIDKYPLQASDWSRSWPGSHHAQCTLHADLLIARSSAAARGRLAPSAECARALKGPSWERFRSPHLKVVLTI